MSWRDTTDDPSANPRHPECEDRPRPRPRPRLRPETSLKTPWTLIDPTDDGSGILARIVTDAEMGHVAVFESPETARATVETMNRAESLEQERGELERELAETRAKLEAEHAEVLRLDALDTCTPAERAVLDAMGRATKAELEYERDHYSFTSIRDACIAQLARRGEKP